MQTNNKIFYKLLSSFWVCTNRNAQITQNWKFAYLCNISRKTLEMKLLFCLQIDTNIFYRVLVSFWVSLSRLVQSTQNNKFAISLQYLEENGENEVGFLLADKHQRFLQIDTIILIVVRHAKLPTVTRLLLLCNIVRKKVSDEVDLLHAYKHVQNHWVAPRLTQPFILPWSTKLVPEISGNLVVKSKLPLRRGLEAVEHNP